MRGFSGVDVGVLPSWAPHLTGRMGSTFEREQKVGTSEAREQAKRNARPSACEITKPRDPWLVHEIACNNCDFVHKHRTWRASTERGEPAPNAAQAPNVAQAPSFPMGPRLARRPGHLSNGQPGQAS